MSGFILTTPGYLKKADLIYGEEAIEKMHYLQNFRRDSLKRLGHSLEIEKVMS